MSVMEIIVVVMILAAVTYSWYIENKARKEAELQLDLMKRRSGLDGIAQELDKNKKEYDSALGGDVPSFMLDNIGKPDPTEGKRASLVADVRSGKLIDTTTGEVVGDAGEVQPVFKDLPAASQPVGKLPS